jgi:hypothetical protein
MLITFLVIYNIYIYLAALALLSFMTFEIPVKLFLKIDITFTRRTFNTHNLKVNNLTVRLTVKKM